MTGLLLNVSNHPSTDWPPAQLEAARLAFETVADRPFPAVHPDDSTEAVAAAADALVPDILARLAAIDGPTAAHVMGEMTLTVALVARLQAAGVRCLASTTTRADSPDGRPFAFVRFRDYPPPP